MVNQVRRIDIDHRISIDSLERVLAPTTSGTRCLKPGEEGETASVGLNELRLRNGVVHSPLKDSSDHRFYTRLATLLDSLRSSLHSLELNLSAPGGTRLGKRVVEGEEFELDSFSSSESYSRSSFVQGLFDFEQLQSLKLSHLELSEDSLADSTGRTAGQLKRLELNDCLVSEEVLLHWVDRNRQTLRSLKLENCRRLTREGIRKIVQRVGSTLKTLDITLPPSISPPAQTRHSLSTPSSPPEFDSLLPFLPRLTDLTLSGPLISPRTLESLSSTSPHLRSISLYSNSHLSPIHLLPLLSPPSNLPHLETLTFSRPEYTTSVSDLHCSSQSSSSSSPPSSSFSSSSTNSQAASYPSNAQSTPVETSSFPPPSIFSPSRPRPLMLEKDQTKQEEDNRIILLELSSLAISRGIRLVGKEFENIQEKIRWAIEEGTKSVGEGEKGETVTRRKRPGVCVV
ncbi:hypothetical protein JCM5350_001925 [Sporobolomyces pararoseus]